MIIAIIGAGLSGLISLKYALDEGYECDVYEQTGSLGGTWVYTDRVGVDEYGLPVHSSMYKGMMTNLPKETMTILDFPYPEHYKSFITQSQVLDYIHNFADKFKLDSHIKYYKHVVSVLPISKKRWILTFQDVKTKIKETKKYDAVFVCNGHYNNPMIPTITGQTLFKGVQLHSHSYRSADPFVNKRVLIIGAGPSGRDIAQLLSKVADRVFISYRGILYMNVTSDITPKTVVKEFYENGVLFEDGTVEDFDAVLYCTGYKHTYPFLTEESGVKIKNNWIRPLYKHIVNVEYPTMYFIGIPFTVCVVPMFDIQARFALAAFGKKFQLPSKETMLNELEEFMRKRKEQGIEERHAHKIGNRQEQEKYFLDLALTAKIRPIPRVVHKIYENVGKIRNIRDCFKIIDDENFIKFDC